MKRIGYNDFMNASQSEIKKTYKISDRRLEKSFRQHLYGATSKEMTKCYEDFYGRRFNG